MAKRAYRFGHLLAKKIGGLARRKPGQGVSPKRSRLPRELAGKWVVWSSDGGILASGDTLSEVREFAKRNAIKGASFERASRSRRASADAKG